jgi:hypothetical protein
MNEITSGELEPPDFRVKDENFERYGKWTLAFDRSESSCQSQYRGHKIEH